VQVSRPSPGARRLQRLGEAVEAAGAHGRQDVVLVLEVAVGRHRRDAQFGGELAHGHRVGTLLGEQPLGRLAKAVPEVGDVGLGKHSGHIDSHICTKRLANRYCLRNKFTT
jgi:hypothetical protein